MFESLPTSQTMSARWTHAALVALLSHGLVIAAAVTSTASPPAATRPISRDTIRLEIADVAEVSHSYTEEFIPAPPRVPDIRMNAPEFQAPRLNFSLPGHAETSRTPLHQSPGRSALSQDSLPSIFSATEVDEAPALMAEIHPRYPEGLRRAGVSGLVEVQYVVGTDGMIDKRTIRVLGSSHLAFSLAALHALLDARFKPARRGGRAEAVLVQQTFRFGFQ
jgi:periplasmic protein TonB